MIQISIPDHFSHLAVSQKPNEWIFPPFSIGWHINFIRGSSRAASTESLAVFMWRSSPTAPKAAAQAVGRNLPPGHESYKDEMLQENVGRKYLSSRCWLAGQRWGVMGHWPPPPLGAPWPHKTDEEFANKDQLSLTVSALSLLIFDGLLCFSPFSPTPTASLSEGLIWQQRSTNTDTCWTFKVPRHLSSLSDL